MNIVTRLCPRVLMIAVLASGNPVLADDLDTRVATVLKATPLIDGHNDLPWHTIAESIITYRNSIWRRT